MGVSLSSDLVAGVMRAADPARLTAATARLQDLHLPEAGPREFAGVLDGLGSTNSPRGNVMATAPSHPAGSSGTYVEFERMVLRNMFESLLPSAESGSFGTGPSAGVWRSLAADQMADVYAGAGGIGTATMLEGDRGDGAAQWPYFRTDRIEAFTG